MKTKISSLLVHSFEDYCKRHKLTRKSATNAVRIDQYARSARTVTVVILYRASDEMFAIDLKCGLVADSKIADSIATYNNAIVSAFAFGTPYLCPCCGEIKFCLTNKMKDSTLNDNEIEQMLDDAIQLYDRYMTNVEAALSGACTFEDAINAAMNGKVQP